MQTFPRSLLSNPKEDAKWQRPVDSTVLAAGSAWAHNCPTRGAGISTASSRAPTIGPHPSGCFCFKAAIRLDGRSYPRQVSLWISLLMSDFSGKDDRVSGLRDTVWLSTFSSRNRVVLIPGWLMRSGSGQAGRPFFLRNGAAATQPAVLTPRSRFLRHTYPISYPHPNKAH